MPVLLPGLHHNCFPPIVGTAQVFCQLGQPPGEVVDERGVNAVLPHKVDPVGHGALRKRIVSDWLKAVPFQGVLKDTAGFGGFEVRPVLNGPGL